MLNALLWKVSRRKSGLARWIRDQAALYLDYYNDFSDDFATNGEARVVRALAGCPMRTVFDVGANAGSWSRMAAEAFPDATIHAFELSESTRAVLRKNLPGARFVVPDVGLSATDGEVTYKDYGAGSTVNTLVGTTFHDDKKAFTRKTARTTTGDAYLRSIGDPVIDFLKIDVEGAEYFVLQGFGAALARGRVRAVQFEYGYANGDAGHLLKAFHDLLSGAGFALGRISSVGVAFGPFDYRMNNFESGPNYLAIRHDDRAVIESLRAES